VLIDQPASAIASFEEQTDPDEAHQGERGDECDAGLATTSRPLLRRVFSTGVT